jgi:hypothetical protein
MVVGRRPARLAIRLRGASLPRARTDSHSTLPWTGRRHAISGAPPTIWPAGVLTGPLEGPHAKGTAAVRLFDGSAHLSFAPTTANAHLRGRSGNKPTTTSRWKRSGQLAAPTSAALLFLSCPSPSSPPHSIRPPHSPGIVLVQFRPGALVCVMRLKAPLGDCTDALVPAETKAALARIGRDHMRAVRTDHLL